MDELTSRNPERSTCVSLRDLAKGAWVLKSGSGANLGSAGNELCHRHVTSPLSKHLLPHLGTGGKVSASEG